MLTSNVSWLVIFLTSVAPVRSGSLLGLATITNIISGITDILTTNSGEHNNTLPEDATLNITELADKYGYNIEEHTVETDDEYILSLHRIPAQCNETNKVVFLMHGLLDSSDSWLLQGPGYALAYILADEGFDVWMGNARGNKYSKAHKSLDTNQTKYWQFSWDEIGMYDIPAMIDYITNVTSKNIYYVGHSQGTTSFLVMNSYKPEYNKKVKMMFSLAPIAWLIHTKSLIVKLFTGDIIFQYFLSMLNEPSNFEDILSNLCKILLSSCDDKIYFFVTNNKLTNDSMLDIVKGHFPTSSSTLQLIHYSQLVQSKRFCRFDFGVEENLKRYGSSKPPDYDVGKTTVPTVLFYSNSDRLSDIADVMLLFNRLPNVYDTYLAYKWDHIDYLYASVAKDTIYAKIVQYIKE